MRALFHLEGLVETGLEHVVDKGIGDPGFTVLHHHRHRQIKGFAVDDRGFSAGLHFDVSAVFYQGKHLRIVVPLHVSAKRLQRFIQWHHVRFAAVSEDRGLPGANHRHGQRQRGFTRGKFQAVCHDDLIL